MIAGHGGMDGPGGRKRGDDYFVDKTGVAAAGGGMRMGRGGPGAGGSREKDRFGGPSTGSQHKGE